MTLKLLLGSALGFGLILATSGCTSTESDTQSLRSTAEQPDHNNLADDHAEHDHGDPNSDKTDMEKMNEALADFSEEDRESAMKQHFCPVSKEMLGTTGPPSKVDVNGRTVWICCDGCRETLLADPNKYLANLDN